MIPIFLIVFGMSQYIVKHSEPRNRTGDLLFGLVVTTLASAGLVVMLSLIVCSFITPRWSYGARTELLITQGHSVIVTPEGEVTAFEKDATEHTVRFASRLTYTALREEERQTAAVQELVPHSDNSYEWWWFFPMYDWKTYYIMRVPLGSVLRVG